VLASKGLKFDSTDRPAIPVLLRASDIASNQNRSLVELCDIESRRLTGASNGSFASEDLNAGRLFVLVDALDEVADDDERISVLSRIQQFHLNYPNCNVVLTSRDYNTVRNLAALKDFETYNLSPIDYKQAQKIIKSLQKGKNLPSEKSQELVRRLEEVHGMELNPLLVTVFAATSEYSRQDIPANITELFKKFTEMMLGRWDAAKGFKQQYHAPLKDFVLQKIAFEMHKEKITRISVERFDAILSTELEKRGFVADTVQLRDEILYRSGLFLIVGDDVEFRHLMMQEFFAGRGIPSAEYLHTVITDLWWRRAIVFYFGENPDGAAALHSAIGSLQSRSIEDNYHSALTLGLALQACYLVEVKDKIDIYRWVVDGLANAKGEFLEAGAINGRQPLARFLLYYLFGRDSVALSVLESRVADILDKWRGTELSEDDKDVRTFWIITGLVESGAMTEAEKLLRKFRPADLRLLLGIHLGCYLTQHVRVLTGQQNSVAKKICEALSGRIVHLRAQLLSEVKTELLEIRGGTIKSIEERSTTAVSEPTKPDA
jgi:predicted NACHT family NTPase